MRIEKTLCDALIQLAAKNPNYYLSEDVVFKYTEQEGLTVLRGSQMSHDPRSSCRKNIIQEREKLLECGKVVDDIFVEDVVFGSPSTAAAVLLGGESNGWIEWKNEDGKTLKEISG